MRRASTSQQLARWRAAISVVFLASGLSLATWAVRVPAIKDAVDVDRAQLGLMLLVGGVASIIGLSVSTVVLARFGARRGMLGSMIAFAAGVAVIGIGADVLHSAAVVTVGLALWGGGNGAVDVMMNVDGAAIEKQTGKTILPLFHAFFSFGTVIGAAVGVAAITVGVDVVTHLVVVAGVIVVVAAISTANVPADDAAADAFTPRYPESDKGRPARPAWRDRLGVALSAWKEPRTYTLGVVMLGMAFAEGGANDWLALGVVEGHDSTEALGAAALATFSVSMAVVRVVGGPLVDRFGRVATLRVLAAAATVGLLLFILAPSMPWVFAGAALWGVGASLGFPLGMSAAADDPARAAARVSAAATIGYVAFLAGPPLLGLVSERIGLLNTLYVLVVLIVASGFASGAARPTAGSAVGAGSFEKRRPGRRGGSSSAAVENQPGV